VPSTGLCSLKYVPTHAAPTSSIPSVRRPFTPAVFPAALMVSIGTAKDTFLERVLSLDEAEPVLLCRRVRIRCGDVCVGGVAVEDVWRVGEGSVGG
jgi:hypothetical protein